MEYTKIPVETFQQIQLNAGILVDAFDPETAEIGKLLGATTGGVSFADAIEYTDFGEDIDNCPKNMLELKKLDSHAVTLSGTFVTMDAKTAKLLAAAADVDSENEGHIIPRNEVLATDFKEVWWIGDYSDKNTGADAGYIAIHMMNALSTGGFAIQSTDKGKGNFAFEFTGHYSMDAQDTVPYEIYIKGNATEPTTGVTLNKTTTSIEEGSTETLVATVVPSDTPVTWTSSADSVATVSDGTITAVAAGTATITAQITVEGQTYSATCEVTVTEQGA